MLNIIRAMVKKDLKEMTNNRQAVLPLIIVPLVLIVFLPVVFLVVISFGTSALNVGGQNLQEALRNYPLPLPYTDEKQNLFFLVLNYMFPMYFLLIPIMTSSIMGASSFVGEKEHKTMETLLYCPISVRELFISKLIGSFIPAFIITLMSFVVFGIVMNIGGLIYLKTLVFPNLKWLVLILWLSPAITLFSLTFIVLVSAKCETFMDAQQRAGFLVLPFILLLVGQVTGLFLLDEWIFLAAGLSLFVLNYFLIRRATARFVPEKLI